MGEIADMMLEGFLDAETGEFIDGDAPGYPRSPHRERRKRLASRHNITKSFTCDWCDRTFRTQQGIDDHCRAKHPEERKKDD